MIIYPRRTAFVWQRHSYYFRAYCQDLLRSSQSRSDSEEENAEASAEA